MEFTNISNEQIKLEQANFMTQVYSWMAGALFITGAIAYWVAGNHEVTDLVLGNSVIFYGLIITELICVGYLSTVIHKIDSQTATALFIAYAALNGLTMSVLFLAFTSESIATAFFITAGTFALMSIYGYSTKKDLTSAGNLAFMGLVGLIISSLVNMYFQNETFYWVTSAVGVLVFVVLTARDTQKIKQMNIIGNEGTDEDKKEAIIGALTLYLDFINLFQDLLNLFGKRKNK